MAISSALTLRRFAARQAELTRQFIAFRLRQEWFALPIEAVQKVVLMGKVHGDMRGTGVSLTVYQDKELLVVDVGRRIFSELLNQDVQFNTSDNSPDRDAAENAQQRYLVIVENSQGELIGLPIDSPPKLRRVPESAFTSLPAAYMSEVNIQCVSSLLIQTKDEPSLFLLNPDQLLVPTGTTKQLKPAI